MTVKVESRGVALIMVLLVLTALAIVAGPFAVSMSLHDRQSSRFEAQVNKGTVAVVSGQIAKENKGDAMRVRTPVSVLAARGTRFVVEVP